MNENKIYHLQMTTSMTVKQREKRIWDKSSGIEGFDEDTFNFVLKHGGKLKRIVEVGCGSGTWSRHLCKIADDLIGIDFSSSLIKEMKRNTNCEAILGDAEFLPLKEESIDQCIFTFSLHHVPNIYQSLEGAIRCLKKNGMIILLEPNGSNFARFLAFRVGRLLGITGIKTSKYFESPININNVIIILEKMGCKCQVWPSLATIRINRKIINTKKDLQLRIYIQYLTAASLIFPNTFGSSDFVLIGIKKT
jgi:SAM-dependent methyltransferase